MNKRTKKLLVLLFLVILVVSGIIIFNILNNNSEQKNNNNETEIITENKNDYQVVSKYNPLTKNYEDVKVKIDNIVRGEDAKKILENYNKETEFPVEIEQEDDEEFIIVNYSIDFDKFSMGKNGVSKDIEAKICQNEQRGYIEYNGKIYSPMVQCMNNFEYTKDNIASGKFVTTIPKNFHDYKIKIGVNDQKLFYFDGV